MESVMWDRQLELYKEDGVDTVPKITDVPI